MSCEGLQDVLACDTVWAGRSLQNSRSSPLLPCSIVMLSGFGILHFAIPDMVACLNYQSIALLIIATFSLSMINFSILFNVVLFLNFKQCLKYQNIVHFGLFSKNENNRVLQNDGISLPYRTMSHPAIPQS